MTTPNDMLDAMSEFKEALKPLEMLAKAMHGLNSSHGLQTDLQLIKEFYSEQERKNLYVEFDVAKSFVSLARDTQKLSADRRSDQRTLEQYAAAHGMNEAQKAFTSDEEVTKLLVKADQQLFKLGQEHPVIYRVYSAVKPLI